MSRYAEQRQLDEADAHARAGRLQQALAMYQALHSARPHDATILDRVAQVLLTAGQPRLAAEALARARSLVPESADYACRHGDALRLSGDFAQAAQAYRAALTSRADHFEALLNLGIVLSMSGRLREGVDAFQKAVDLRPGEADAHANLGEALRRSKRIGPALDALRRAVDLAPRNTTALANLGMAFRDDNQLHEAEACYRRAVDLDPGNGRFLSNLGGIVRDSGRAEGAMTLLRRAAALLPDDRDIATHLVYSSHFDPQISPDEVFELHVDWGQRFAEPITQRSMPAEPRDLDPNRRLRIGYVSPHFQHSVISFLFEPLIEHHDHDAFEITCFSDVTTADAVTERMRAHADAWVESAGLSDAQLDAAVRGRAIDVLVDLSGHIDRNRLTLFARRPAPVQVTYLGYPDTTGMRSIDWRITDSLHDPTELGGDSRHTERLWRLPRCAWAFRPPADPPPASLMPPMIANGHVTFGSLNILSKVNDRVIEAWSEILRRVEKSRLLLLCAKDEPSRQAVRQRFAECGRIDPERVELLGRQPREAYLDTFNRIDVALDPFPFAGHTTSLDTLLMGVPLVTLAGVTHVQRTGVSLLATLGLGQLIVNSVQEYVELAVALIADGPERIVELRRDLPRRLRESALMDGAGLARAVEAAYREMWQLRCAPRNR